MGKHPTEWGPAYIGCGEEKKRRYMFMGHYNAGFALIVVLFILLIIVGSAFC
jgi:uncharacterized protein (TIGR01732 family)